MRVVFFLVFSLFRFCAQIYHNIFNILRCFVWKIHQGSGAISLKGNGTKYMSKFWVQKGACLCYKVIPDDDPTHRHVLHHGMGQHASAWVSKGQTPLTTTTSCTTACVSMLQQGSAWVSMGQRASARVSAPGHRHVLHHSSRHHGIHLNNMSTINV